ncbi:DUF2809 domain-containing protein [Fredinandcohnia quinoae]|uniref:DUF2809 domain-containing protein n=1 Tax=Fredinandcohnia quinoae TaxID=2918902 RepID=A0AAW5E4J0_9BACI|nr:DUF2809 domain-containing protein [Fredinandcohnia sp. SECRCQ15]MCH1624033.1 DUF2809 domain-containing protein [Fredinandcohnia sp. SECRCQ15]
MSLIKTHPIQLRLLYSVAIIVTIFLGLASRKYGYLLPPFVAENGGDMLWAMMVYFGFRFLFVRKSFISALVLCFIFTFGIEFSQLYQAEWMHQIRGTVLGALIFGKGFLLVDLVRYSGGIMIAVVLDKIFLK